MSFFSLSSFFQAISNSLPLILSLYVLSGVLQPLVLEVLNYNGTCDHSTMLLLLPNYLGMSMTYFSPNKSNSTSASGLTSNNYKGVILLCFIDIISQTLNLLGLLYAGSLLFTILYSSCTLWTAILSYVILKRTLHPMQWLSVVTIFIGLCVASAGSIADGKNVMTGSFMIVAGSIFHSLTYILSEKLMIQNSDPIPPESLSYIMGITGTVVYSLWQVMYTIPNYQLLILDPIASHHGSLPTIFMTFPILILINFIHAFCFFNLLGVVGATTTGVLKGINSVMVFVLSHVAFCSIQQSQCFTYGRALSLVVVVVGVVGYSYFNPSLRTSASYLSSSISTHGLSHAYTFIQDKPLPNPSNDIKR